MGIKKQIYLESFLDCTRAIKSLDQHGSHFSKLALVFELEQCSIPSLGPRPTKANPVAPGLRLRPPERGAHPPRKWGEDRGHRIQGPSPRPPISTPALCFCCSISSLSLVSQSTSHPLLAKGRWTDLEERPYAGGRLRCTKPASSGTPRSWRCLSKRRCKSTVRKWLRVCSVLKTSRGTRHCCWPLKAARPKLPGREIGRDEHVSKPSRPRGENCYEWKKSRPILLPGSFFSIR